jgi:hypothetical protein
VIQVKRVPRRESQKPSEAARPGKPILLSRVVEVRGEVVEPIPNGRRSANTTDFDRIYEPLADDANELLWVVAAALDVCARQI